MTRKIQTSGVMTVPEIVNRHANERVADVVVRSSREGDVDAMLAIYLHHIRRGVDASVSFEIDAPQLADLRQRRKNMQKHRLPHLVADRAGTVVGYAYAAPLRKRPVYRYVVKHSIYVHHERLHSGIGRLLLPALIDACAAAGYRQMIGYIDAGLACRLLAMGMTKISYKRYRVPSESYKYTLNGESILGDICTRAPPRESQPHRP